MSTRPTPRQALDHVEAELARREWSARRGAEESIKKGLQVSNQTWSTNIAAGRVTLKMRKSVAVAFDWPIDWDTNLPELSQPTPPAAEPPTTADARYAKILMRLEKILDETEAALQGQNLMLANQNRLLAGQDELRAGQVELMAAVDKLRPPRRRAAGE